MKRSTETKKPKAVNRMKTKKAIRTAKPLKAAKAAKREGGPFKI